MKIRTVSLKRTTKRFINLFKNPFFWALTIVGNSIMIIGSFLLWIFESRVDASVKLLDCILWSAGAVTTVGYGELTPQTVMGKLTVLGLMLFGTLFVWSYMAFLVTGLIAPELASLERDVHEVEQDIREMKVPPTAAGTSKKPMPSSQNR